VSERYGGMLLRWTGLCPAVMDLRSAARLSALALTSATRPAARSRMRSTPRGP
jgi:hypothetical protein